MNKIYEKILKFFRGLFKKKTKVIIVKIYRNELVSCKIDPNRYIVNKLKEAGIPFDFVMGYFISGELTKEDDFMNNCWVYTWEPENPKDFYYYPRFFDS